MLLGPNPGSIPKLIPGRVCVHTEGTPAIFWQFSRTNVQCEWGFRRLLWVGGPSRYQAPRTGRYKKRVSLLEPLLRDLGNRGDALARSLPSRRSIWGSFFRRERLRERGPSSRRASEGCPPRDGAIEVVSTSEPSGNRCWYPAVQYASGHINFQRTHAAVSAPKAWLGACFKS